MIPIENWNVESISESIRLQCHIMKCDINIIFMAYFDGLF